MMNIPLYSFSERAEANHVPGARKRSGFVLLAVLVFSSLSLPCLQVLARQARPPILVDNFEIDSVGDIPSRWWGLDGRKAYPLSPSMRENGEYYGVVREDDNQFLRVRTENESIRIVVPNGNGMEWNLDIHPGLSWKWRARELPPGAREDEQNDTAGAMYITFSFDWIGRPRSIKYTYSSTLPVGTVVDQGRLQIIVVASGEEHLGEWETIVRNVAADYRRVFGREPPERPVSIAIWSDSDSTHSTSEIDFDEVRLMPPTANR